MRTEAYKCWPSPAKTLRILSVRDQGNALSAAADNAAEFVSLAIQQTPADQDTRYGVWFEPLLPRLCPVSWSD